MQCPTCHRILARDARFCGACGGSLPGRRETLELVLPDGERVPVTTTLTLGRASDNAVQLRDPSVSRHHARVVPIDGGARLEDAGSSHGTFLDGHRLAAPELLHHGAKVGLGDAVVAVEYPGEEWEAGRTIVVTTDAASATGAGPARDPAGDGGTLDRRPRARSGWAMKRLAADEGPDRYILRDLERGQFLRMSADEAALFAMLDGRNDVTELLAAAERRLGDDGPARLAGLLAELGDRGLLEGVDAAPAPLRGSLARIVGPRTLVSTRAGDLFERTYRGGGWVLLTSPALTLLALIAGAGLVAFVALVLEGGRTPFLVRGQLTLGVIAFLLGRFLVVALHEWAHGLVVAAMGRRVPRAGIKLVLVFPYAFVDTSEAWFEPRGRRMLISAAGPASDLILGGAFSLLSVVAGPTTAGEVSFQLALAAYLGAVFNLNPFLDRDGYHLLVDALRQPNLRQRSRRRLARALAGREDADADADGRTLLVYGTAAVGWSFACVALVVVASRRYAPRIEAVASPTVTWALLGVCYAGAAVPIAVMLGRPLYERWRNPPVADEQPPA
jgi:putative peptide zinc metalloprotease protein